MGTLSVIPNWVRAVFGLAAGLAVVVVIFGVRLFEASEPGPVAVGANESREEADGKVLERIQRDHWHDGAPIEAEYKEVCKVLERNQWTRFGADFGGYSEEEVKRLKRVAAGVEVAVERQRAFARSRGVQHYTTEAFCREAG